MKPYRFSAILYSIILIIGIALALPNLFNKEFMHKYLPFLPDTHVTLGLDLKGGSYLVLEIDKAALIREKLHDKIAKINKLFTQNNIVTNNLQKLDNKATFTLQDPKQINEALSIIKKIDDNSGIEIASNGNQISINLSESALKTQLDQALIQSIEIIRKRVDEVGVAEPSIQKIGANRIMVQLPGMQKPGELRTLLGKTAKLTFHFVDRSADKNDPPIGVSVLPSFNSKDTKFAIKDEVSLDGSALTDARAFEDMNVPGGMVKILFKLNSEGARIFREITEENIGQAFAIVLDDKVLTAPTIQGVIPNGSGEITGSFTMKEAIQISALLRAGALPVPLTVVEEHTVGPDLGAHAIHMGLYTGIVGFILVAIFIFLLYGSWGLIADIALALHTILTFSALSLLGATLTLPGIAGIILGIGVAVDANILINERIKEESRRGMSALAAVERGFKQAFSTIVDANVTAIIATILLYYYGSGPVRGFAVTMGLGIIISMFTDVTLVRIIMLWVIRKRAIRNIEITPFFKFLPITTKIKFMNARFLGIAVSIVLSLASVFLMHKPGLNYGIDFKGGIQMLITPHETADLEKLRQTLSALKIGEVGLQKVKENNSILIHIEKQPGSELLQTQTADKARAAITKLYPKAIFGSTEVIGPKVSGELAKSGFMAVILASIATTLYIWWRFEWFFAVGAIITLILDVTKMVGFFALFQIDFNLTAIAAMLTIVGYSINDKVVVYDRMRENLRLYKTMPLRQIIDMSINQVFIRCLFTSLATILAMLPMAIWGGIAVHNFSIPVIMGIIIATSSSIFIATPILLFLGNWRQTKLKTTNKNN